MQGVGNRESGIQHRGMAPAPAEGFRHDFLPTPRALLPFLLHIPSTLVPSSPLKYSVAHVSNVRFVGKTGTLETCPTFFNGLLAPTPSPLLPIAVAIADAVEEAAFLVGEGGFALALDLVEKL